MFPCPEISSKKSFPAVLTLAKQNYDFDIPEPQKPERGHITVRAEIITELIPEGVRPVIFLTFLLEFKAFRLIPVICPVRRAKPENYWKRYLIPNKANPAIKQ